MPENKLPMKPVREREFESKKKITAPARWQSDKSHPETHLAYITDAERVLLQKLDLHGSGLSPENPHYGPKGIPSLNGMGGGGGSSGGDRGDRGGGFGGSVGGGGMGSNNDGGSRGGGSTGGGSDRGGNDRGGGYGGSVGGGGMGSNNDGGSRGGGNDRGGGYGGSVGGGGMGANNDRGGGFGGGNDRGGGGISGGAANSGGLGGMGNAANGGFGGGGFGGGGGAGPGRGDITGGLGPGGAGGNVAGQTAAASGQSVSGAAIDGVNAALGSDATDSTTPGATSIADVFGGVNAVPGLPGVSATPGITVSDALTPSTQTVASTFDAQIAQNLAQAQSAISSPTSVTSALSARTSTPMGLTAISGFNTTPASNALAGAPMDAMSLSAAQAMASAPLGTVSPGMVSDMATMSAKSINSALGMDGTLADSSSTGVDFGDIAGMGVAQAALGPVNASTQATTAEDALNNDIIGAMNSVPSSAAQRAAQEAALAQAMNNYDAGLAARGFQAIDTSTTDANALAIGLGPINDPATFSTTPAQTAASMAMVDDPALAPANVAQQAAQRAAQQALLDRTFAPTPSRIEALSANRQQVSSTLPSNELASLAFAPTANRIAALNPATVSPAIGPAPDTNLSGVPGAFSNANDLSGYMDVTNAVNSYSQGKYGQAVSDLIDSVGLSNAIQMGGLLLGGSGSGMGPREPGGGNDGGLLADSGRGGSGGSGGGDGNTPTLPSGYMPDWWMDWRNNYGQYGLLGPIPVRNALDPGGYVYA